MFRMLLAACAMTLAPIGAVAQDEFELSYGFSVTTDASEVGDDPNSSDVPALEGYVVGQRGLIYVGAWTSTPLDFGDSDALEVDVFAGIETEVGDLGLDLGYTRFFYGDGGDCCGEFGLEITYPVDDFVGVGLEFSIDPAEGATWTEFATGVSVGDVWEVDGAIGSDFGSEELGGGTEYDWDLGMTRSFGDNWWAEVRYEDSNYEAAALVLSVGADF